MAFKQEKEASAVAHRDREFNYKIQKDIQDKLEHDQEIYQKLSSAAPIANKMLKILRKNKNNWSGLSGYLSSFSADRATYTSDGIKLAKALSSGKGAPTKYNLITEQQAKPYFEQAVQTQEELLQEIVNDYESAKK